MQKRNQDLEARKLFLIILEENSNIFLAQKDVIQHRHLPSDSERTIYSLVLLLSWQIDEIDTDSAL